MSFNRTWEISWAAPVLSSNTSKFPYFYLTIASWAPNSSLLFLRPWPEKCRIFGVYSRIGLKLSMEAKSFLYHTDHFVLSNELKMHSNSLLKLIFITAFAPFSDLIPRFMMSGDANKYARCKTFASIFFLSRSI